ncbi:MAG: hypothetical protein D6794_00170 [Deltaproteobacteria bacterium]|nr:MAG: hypothetical protein D6794_00170 [Deltaproteobacteria bacterium]
MLPFDLIDLFLGAITLLCLTGFVLLYCKLNRMTRQLTTLVDTREQPGEQAGQTAPDKPFDSALLGANMKSLLRQQANAATPTERYRFIRSLAAHGLEPQQIAEILNIGRGEAEQLVKLARLRVAAKPTEVAA